MFYNNTENSNDNDLNENLDYNQKNLAINNGEPILKQKFKEKWPIISEEDIKSVEELMKKGEISYYGLEGKLKEFEEEICKYHNVKYAIAVNSGTSSLHSAFFGINLGS